MNKNDTAQVNIVERPPVVVVMGHIDHGKSKLLDYIRKTNVVEGEAGGITQHISAYEVVHKDDKGIDKKITFLDTPGHEAFSKMRARGARVADIAILVVSAEDGVKAQTIEALNSIRASKIPFIVAINKIDKPGANIEKTKIDLVENEVYVEGYGGSVPCAEISAKIGTGIDNLLDMILILSEMEELKGDLTLPATGVVIEAHLDPKRGVSATLLIKNGTLKKNMFVVVGNSLAGTRIMENFLGKAVDEISFSSPTRITGFDTTPTVGETFTSFESKKDAENHVCHHVTAENLETTSFSPNAKLIPLIIKVDFCGSGEAIEKEVKKLTEETVAYKIISHGVGNIGEADIKLAASDPDSIIVGFNVKIDSNTLELNEKTKVTTGFFDTIYKLTDFLKEEMNKRRPRQEVEEIIGEVKILKTFSQNKDRQIIGGRVVTGKMSSDSMVKIKRRDFELGTGKILNLEKGKSKTSEVSEGDEFGMMLESKVLAAPGDILEPFIMVTK